jgi:hypothetical protein
VWLCPQANAVHLRTQKKSVPLEAPPAQPISSDLPNISTRAPAQSNTLIFFGDLLVWKAEESGTENWGQTYGNGFIDIHSVSFPWDVGFRVGAGYGMKHDEWDTQLYYTRFKTVGKDRVSSPDIVTSPFLGNFYIDNAFGISDSGPTYHRSSIRWGIDFNIFDLELGRKYRPSKAIVLRPFIGLKGGWIHQKIHSTWKDPEDSLLFLNPFTTAKENLKNNFWGIGPSVGLNTSWRLKEINRHAFYLFGDFSGALMYGHWTFKDVYTNDFGQKVSIDLSPINGAASMFRSFMGMQWAVCSKTDRFRFSIKLGYEMQFWLQQLQFYTLNVGRLLNTLTLQGGTLDFGMEF